MENEFYNRLIEAKRYTDRIGTVYGTEDLSVYLYSIMKMMKPKTVVELGTGLGSTMLWSALALEENNYGVLYTIDDGSEWHRIKTVKDMIGKYFYEDYSDFILNLIETFKISERVRFINEKISVLKVDKIDILFSDFAHGVFDVTKLLADYIPKMNDYSKIYIDSASTHYSSYHTLEKIVDILNSGKIPRSFEEVSDFNYDMLIKILQRSSFSIEHIIENKDRDQNSTCCITISPIDIFPYPRKNLRI
jgi:predicted O-methyltransferase YrrM